MNIKTYFTQQTNVKQIIIDLLNTANFKVTVAVAWFTEFELFNTILKLQKRNIEVEVIITNHEFNKLNYQEITNNGGFFAEIGNDDKLMHMKFCVIDYNIVINGSANWSKRAFTENNEEVTIVKNSPERANEFIDEFDRLKKLTGIEDNQHDRLNLSNIIKNLDLIQALINVGDTVTLNQYVHRLKKEKEIEDIIKQLLTGDYASASKLIFAFKKFHSQIVDVTVSEKIKIKAQINLLSMQIELLEIEKTELEALIKQFNHRYVIELNPLISKILRFKKKIYAKLKKHGLVDNTYEDIENEFNKNNEEYDKEVKINIPELSNEEAKSLKEIYRDSVKLCHPDSSHCIFQDKTEASKTFNSLVEAFKHNNIDKVKYIYGELKLGKPIENIDDFKELDFLRAKLITLKKKYEYLIKEFQDIKANESYIIIQSIGDWDEYFDIQKAKLNDEIKQLNKKYAKE